MFISFKYMSSLFLFLIKKIDWRKSKKYVCGFNISFAESKLNKNYIWFDDTGINNNDIVFIV